MNLYEKPNMNVLKMCKEDIVTTSFGLVDDGEGGNDSISGEDVFG